MATFRDNTLEAISDGLYVSPAIETADYHASLNKNSWFYVFDYQSKYGDYTTVRKILQKWLWTSACSYANQFPKPEEVC